VERLVEKPTEAEAAGFSGSLAGVRFRPMNSSDLSEVIEIERASFAYPWSTNFFLQELKVGCARSLLAVVGDKSIGYVIYWLLQYEIDIHNLAVHPAYRRQGVGKALLEAVIEEARRQGASRVTLEVRKSNEVAQKLYQALGFSAKGVRTAYYSDDGEDALIMALELEGSV
jgi:[ribosomal protein S18]-alanine N-acetyltransferase